MLLYHETNRKKYEYCSSFAERTSHPPRFESKKKATESIERVGAVISLLKNAKMLHRLILAMAGEFE